MESSVHGTPVHAALHRRHVKVFQLLLQHCVGVDVRDLDGQTQLHVAISNALLELSNDEDLAIMWLLLDHGADREAMDASGSLWLRSC